MSQTKQPINGGLRRLLSWGTGVGIAVQEARGPDGNAGHGQGPGPGKDLCVVVSTLRPSGVTVVAETRIANVEERPSAEWGAELAAFLRKHGAAHIGAVLLMPRAAVTVRSVPMMGVADADLAAAVSFQVDALHPYDEADAVNSWARLAGTNQVLVGVAQATVVNGWATRFAEAGVKLASVSFSAAAFYRASRMYRTPPEEFLAAAPAGESWELYGESQARPVFSSTFDRSERMMAMARSDLRLANEVEVTGIERLLPAPLAAPEGFDVRVSAAPFAASLASAAPRFALQANLLPESQRVSGAAWAWAPTAVLAGLLVIAAGLLGAQESYLDKQYLKRLNNEIVRYEKLAQRAQALDAEAHTVRERVKLLDDFRRRSGADANALKEITALIPPPGWLNNLSMNRSTVNISGEADQAAGLVEVFDKSPLFSQTSLGQLTGLNFALRMNRKGAGTGEPAAPKAGAK